MPPPLVLWAYSVVLRGHYIESTGGLNGNELNGNKMGVFAHEDAVQLFRQPQSGETLLIAVAVVSEANKATVTNEI